MKCHGVEETFTAADMCICLLFVFSSSPVCFSSNKRWKFGKIPDFHGLISICYVVLGIGPYPVLHFYNRNRMILPARLWWKSINVEIQVLFVILDHQDSFKNSMTSALLQWRTVLLCIYAVNMGTGPYAASVWRISKITLKFGHLQQRFILTGSRIPTCRFLHFRYCEGMNLSSGSFRLQHLRNKPQRFFKEALIFHFLYLYLKIK